jgi:hypothetical protein
MSKGITSLTFHGGPHDGEVLADVPGIRVFPLVVLPTGRGFTEEPDGRVGVYAKTTERPSNWFMFETARYAKREAEPGSTGVHYDFLEMAIVSRCRAITIKNEWCKNESVASHKVCRTHARNAAVVLKPDQ